MSDVGSAAAAAPPVAMESIGDAAAGRLQALRSDPAFGAKRLGGDAAASNEFKTLMSIVHGEHDDATQAALAASIDLKPKPSLAAAERQQAADAAAAEAMRPNLGVLSGKYSSEEISNLSNDIGQWLGGLKLPPTTNKTILDRISSEGPKVGAMTPDERSAWITQQRQVLEGAARSKEVADGWMAAARKLLEGSKYDLSGNAPVLFDAYVVRHLALAAAQRK
jgi:hypothetical protein